METNQVFTESLQDPTRSKRQSGSYINCDDKSSSSKGIRKKNASRPSYLRLSIKMIRSGRDKFVRQFGGITNER